MNKNKKGFTLVELVIVIAVIAILAAVLLPTFAGILERARENTRLQRATSTRDEYISGNFVLPMEVVGTIINVDNSFYYVNSDLTLEKLKVNTIEDYKNENFTYSENSSKELNGTIIYIPTIQESVKGFVTDSEGNIYNWDYLVKNSYITQTKLKDGTYELLRNDKFNSAGFVSLTIDSSVSKLGWQCFWQNTSLIDVYMPDSVIAMDYGAFYGCTNLTNIQISNNIEDMGYNVFYNCSSLVTYTEGISTYIGNEQNPYLILYKVDKTNLAEYVVNEKTAILYSNIFSGSKPSSVIIPYGLKCISDYCFTYNSSIKKLVLPDSVLHIKDSVFDFCSNLEEIVLSKNLKTIGEMAFRQCSKLKSIGIPDTIESVGRDAFMGCTLLVDETEDITYIGNEDNPYSVILKASTEIETLTINENTKVIVSTAFKGCTKLKSLTITKNIIEIGTEAFNGCSGLENLYVESGNKRYEVRETNAIVEIDTDILVLGCKNTIIPTSCTKIGEFAFAGSGLVSVDIPSNITSIEICAFKDCASLVNINIPTSVTNIVQTAFSGCTSLTQIELPSSITKIPAYLFMNCKNLIDVTIPSTITSIGYGAFEYCTSLMTIRIPASVKRIDTCCFYECTNLTNVIIGDNSKSNYTGCWSTGSLVDLIDSANAAIKLKGTYKYSSLTRQ